MSTKVLDLLAPFPRPHLEQICSIKFTQPPLLGPHFLNPLRCGHHIWKPSLVLRSAMLRSHCHISYDREALRNTYPGRGTAATNFRKGVAKLGLKGALIEVPRGVKSRGGGHTCCLPCPLLTQIQWTIIRSRYLRRIFRLLWTPWVAIPRQWGIQSKSVMRDTKICS